MPTLPLLPLVVDAVPEALRRALSREGVPWADRAAAPLAGRLVLFDSRRRKAPPLAEGQTAIAIDATWSDSEADPLSALADEHANRQAWNLGPLRVTEQIARHDKRAQRRRLMDGLRRAVEGAGGIWLRIAAHPHPYRGAFTFRFDHDEYVAADFDAVLTAIDGHETATSHYVCASTHAAHPEALARLRGLDVGSHGYRHHTYLDPLANRRNISRGIETLRAHGLEPRGFVAPHGRWTRDMAEALGDLRISHGGEFGWAYDDWPGFVLDEGPRGPHPPVPGVDSQRPLQLPVHPVCLGIALEAARGLPSAAALAAEAVVDLVAGHFQTVVRERLAAGEPTILYGHPDGRLGRYPRLLRETFAQAGQLPGLWRTNCSLLAEWWRQRDRIRLEVHGDRQRLKIVAEGLPDNWQVAVEHFEGSRLARRPLDGPVSEVIVESLEHREVAPPALPSPRPVMERTDLRGRLLGYLDWEHVTPTSEINVGTWRGRIKRSLRGLRDRRRVTV
jgi:hypothetical protein